jgi:Zn-finger nucleic acid-binding protein
MDCPVCKTAMITLELNEVEIDHCLECSGIWLDAGELEMLLPDSEKAKQLLDSFKKLDSCKEKPRKCPICLKKMHKVNVGSDDCVVLIDSCAKGDGLWFDKGELHDIFKIGAFDDEGKIENLLTDMFGSEN